MEFSAKTMKSVPFRIMDAQVNISHNADPFFERDAADRCSVQSITPSSNTIRRAGVQDRVEILNNVFFANFASHQNNGDVYFLPFRNDNIHSIRLPRIPGVNDGKMFITSQLDGCAIFIDVKANNIIVHHANAMTGVSPTREQSATQPRFQTGACVAKLNTLYQLTVAHFNNTDGPNQMQNVEFRKPDYLERVQHRIDHLANNGRFGVTDYGNGNSYPEHGSYTTFAGFFVNNHWEFWFQTYSQFIYTRPESWKSKIFNKERVINPDVTRDNYEVVDCRCVFRV